MVSKCGWHAGKVAERGDLAGRARSIPRSRIPVSVRNAAGDDRYASAWREAFARVRNVSGWVAGYVIPKRGNSTSSVVRPLPQEGQHGVGSSSFGSFRPSASLG